MADKRIIQLPDTPGLDTTTDEMVVDNATDGARRVPVGRAGGVASLNSAGAVEQEPASKGVADGIAALNAAGMPLTAAGEAVVESGSNADGNWVKFADGTMVCWFNDQIVPTKQSSTTQGLTIYRGYFSWTFPQPFIGAPSVSVNGRLFLGATALAYGVPSAYWGDNVAGVSGWAAWEALVDFDTIVQPGLIAIGRWK
ncbi:hypothetical protein [Oceanithermus sp.]|uniref:hypothetical protein n=1 Tax=Oceanithermus sp. TaxID=2268145 RepID=UPI0025810934|nr:hypothetical protein [Oceanithermus sp.]